MENNRHVLILVTLFIFVIFLSSTGAFSSFQSIVTTQAVQKITNHQPRANSILPQDKEVIGTNNPVVSWRYYDEDNDIQQLAYIEISTDAQFTKPLPNWASGSSTSAYLDKPLEDKRDYYIRIKVNDGKDWSDWSEINKFSVYVKEKKCSDGTDYYQCSTNQPYLCSAGTLTKQCSECGCPANYRCNPNSKECSFIGFPDCIDNTPNNMCSTIKPKICINGILVDNCDSCSCPGDAECQSDGTCLKTIKEIVTINEEQKQENLFIKILTKIGFFIRSIFTT